MYPATDDISRTLQTLRSDRDQLCGPQRREVAAALGQVLWENGPSPSALELVYLLAEDPDWEVRYDVAHLLLRLPERDLARLVAKLSEDNNVFVRNAAERALERRRKGQIQTRPPQPAQLHWENLERLHGKKVAETARQAAEELFDQLVGATVHEMRGVLTPLKASVTSLVNLLERGATEAGGLRRQVSKASGRLAFLQRLLDDMRDYSQPLSRQRRGERLYDLVKEAVSIVRENLLAGGRNPKRVQVFVSVPEEITLMIARHQIVAAVANVVKNAFDAYATGPKGFGSGEVRLSARRTDDDQVELVVEDRGVGICAEDLEEIRQFIPGKTTKKNLGTGFGLPTARKNVMAHGGSLSIESQEGQGTTITMVLPVGQQ